MICDVCNSTVSPGEGRTVSAEIFRHLMSQGFGIHKSNIEMLTSGGFSRERAIETLRQQYSTYTSDWLLCQECSKEAEKVAGSGYLEITDKAREYHGIAKLGCRIFISQETWDKCVQWDELDIEKQDYQDQEARLHDILNVLSSNIELNFNKFSLQNGWEFAIFCILRDGKMTEGVKVNFIGKPLHIDGDWGLAIEYLGFLELDGD